MVVLAAGLALTTAPVAAARKGAGLVVRHGDGRLVVAYVEFDEPQISGAELLRRAGLTVVSAQLSPGQAVCSINGEGCPADTCFCKSYGNPPTFWRYYHRRDGR